MVFVQDKQSETILGKQNYSRLQSKYFYLFSDDSQELSCFIFSERIKGMNGPATASLALYIYYCEQKAKEEF